MSDPFTSYQHSTGEIEGSTGDIVARYGGLASCVRSSPGIYLIGLNPAANSFEHIIGVNFLGANVSGRTYEAEWVSEAQIRVRTMNAGILFDADFSIEVNRYRTGLPEKIPTPVPGPVPGPFGSGPYIDLDNATPIPGDDTVVVGLTVRDVNGSPITTPVLLEIAVFSDSGLSIPSLNASMAGAIEGSIVATSGNALKILTDALGRFSCTLTDFIDETVYLGTSTSFGSPSLDCSEIDTITFAP